MRKIAELRELACGEGVSFEALVRGETRPCVLVQTANGPVAYVNVCAHRNQPVVVDRQACDDEGFVECRAHGARYRPDTGECVEGPCVGAHLVPVTLHVSAGFAYAVDDDLVDDSVYGD